MRKKHGHFGTPTYVSWIEMRRRCYDKNRKEYPRYGGRGIRVCAAWNDTDTGFAAFLRDMGPRPDREHTIGRRDSTKDYTPENCRWETVAQQNDNKSTTIRLTYAGLTLTLATWVRLCGVPRATLYDRHRRGWSDADVLRDVVKAKFGRRRPVAPKV